MKGSFSSLQNAHLLLIQLTHHLLHCLGFAAHIMLHSCCLQGKHRHANCHWCRGCKPLQRLQIGHT